MGQLKADRLFIRADCQLLTSTYCTEHNLYIHIAQIANSTYTAQCTNCTFLHSFTRVDCQLLASTYCTLYNVHNLYIHISADRQLLTSTYTAQCTICTFLHLYIPTFIYTSRLPTLIAHLLYMYTVHNLYIHTYIHTFIHPDR